MRNVLRLKHMSFRTEEAYVHWVKRFILFHDKCHPKDIGAPEIRAFLTHLAVHDKVAASTQNGALHALLFLYRHVLKLPVTDLQGIERAKRPRRVPTVFAREEVQAVLVQLSGVNRLMANLLYGAGLRLMECVRLRVKDIDFAAMTFAPCKSCSAIKMSVPQWSTHRYSSVAAKRCAALWTHAEAAGCRLWGIGTSGAQTRL